MVSSGTFTHGHLGPSALSELIRFGRPGAVFAIGINADHFVAMGFAGQLAEQSAAGTITDVDPRTVDMYLPGASSTARPLSLQCSAEPSEHRCRSAGERMTAPVRTSAQIGEPHRIEVEESAMKHPIATQSPRRNVQWTATVAAALIILSGTGLLPRSAEPPLSLGGRIQRERRSRPGLPPTSVGSA